MGTEWTTTLVNLGLKLWLFPLIFLKNKFKPSREIHKFEDCWIGRQKPYSSRRWLNCEWNACWSAYPTVWGVGINISTKVSSSSRWWTMMLAFANFRPSFFPFLFLDYDKRSPLIPKEELENTVGWAFRKLIQPKFEQVKLIRLCHL